MNESRPAPDVNLRASRGTPFHASTSALNQTTWWYGWGPYVVPDVYTTMPEEMNAIRNAVALIDMSPLPKVRLAGRDAMRLADRLVTRDLAKLAVGQVFYTPWCDETGHLIGDGLVFRLAADCCTISGELSLPWIQRQAMGLDVEIADVMDSIGVLSLQGPHSRTVLEAATGDSWSDLGFSRIGRTRIADVEITVARQGFTGERGYELWVAREHGAEVWDAVMAAGRHHGIKPAGEYAVDIARVEAGLLLVSTEYTGAGWSERCANVAVDPQNLATPYEVGLGRFVDLGKEDFSGRSALATMSPTNANRRTFVGLAASPEEVIDLLLRDGRTPNVSPRVRWDAMPVRRDGQVVGRATSLTWSPTARTIIGFACVSPDASDLGRTLQVDWSDEWAQPLGTVDVTVVETPFVKLRRSS
jgi:aminomethyltransferase